MLEMIVVDSCCDLTPEMMKDWGVVSVPLTMRFNEREYVDDESLDLKAYLADMKECKTRFSSAAPAPMLYKEAFEQINAPFAVTLSSNLSGSYNSAVAGAELCAFQNTYVFDSKSASAGEVLIVKKIRKMLDAGEQKNKIIAKIESFIRDMETFFVLDNTDNLMKNGRMNKVVGKLISVLNIKPLLGSDKKGNISLYSHARGEKQVIEKLADTVEKSGRITDGECMVISHCDNLSLAEKLKSRIIERYNFAEITIVQTKGLSSMYASDKGIIIAY